MFSSLYWERLEGGKEGREDYNFMYNIAINIHICSIIQEQMNVGITFESGKQVPAYVAIPISGFILCCISLLLSKIFAVPKCSAIC